MGESLRQKNLYLTHLWRAPSRPPKGENLSGTKDRAVGIDAAYVCPFLRFRMYLLKKDTIQIADYG